MVRKDSLERGECVGILRASEDAMSVSSASGRRGRVGVPPNYTFPFAKSSFSFSGLS